MRRFAITASVIFVAVAMRAPVQAQSPATVAEPWDAYASEELVVRLAPYLLGPADVPPGYTLGGADAETPAELAALRRPADSDPAAVFTQIRALWIVQVHEYLMLTAAAAPTPPLTFTVSLAPDSSPFASPATRPPDATARDLPDTLGETRDAWQEPVSQLPQPPLQRLVIRWKRGALVFELQQLTATAEQDFATLRGFAAQIDVRERQAPPYDSSPPSVTPVASEPQRLQTLLYLQAITNGAAPPPGYQVGEPVAMDSAQLALQSVLQGADPAAVLEFVTQTYPLVAGLFVAYAPMAPGQSAVGVGLALYGTAAAAQTDLFLVQPAPIHPWTSVMPVAAPVTLGDTTTAVEAHATGEGPDGGGLVLSSLNWTHGALRLGVAMEGQVDWSLLSTVAEQLENSFQASPTQ